MSNQQIEDLFSKYFTDLASEQELAAFKEKIGSMPDNEIEAMLAGEWRKTEGTNSSLRAPDSGKMLQYILSKGSKENAPVIKGRFTWLRPGIAAAVLVLISAGWWLMNRHENQSALVQNQKHDVLPGADRAMLTLADGSVIVLDSAKNGSLAQQGGAAIIKLKSGQLAYEGTAGNTESNSSHTEYNIITTPRGGQYQIVLPDGSKVWLNADSYIRFPTVFNGKQRNVEIKGEVYLEIAKNKSQPFIVKTKNTQIEVLGTGFNVMAYDDEPATKTTLLEGSVKVWDDVASTVLMPGQQAIANDKNISKETLDPEDIEQVVAWKNNEFRFNNDNLESIMRLIARWYNVNVVYEGADKDLQFGGVVSRKENVSVVLKKLELTGVGVKFRIEGKTIFVK